MTSAFSLPVAKPNLKTFENGKPKVQATAQVIAVPNPKLYTTSISKTDIYQISQVIEKQTRANSYWTLPLQHNCRKPQFDPSFLEEAYESCRDICAHYAKTFHLGTLLMTPERRKAIWAIYVWCRRTDELVDGPNAEYMSTGTAVLDRWEERLEDIFNGRPYDLLDAALTHTVQSFPIDIKPFRDMIEGMRMDIHKSRYLNFEELYRYCYYVAGTVGLMTVPVMGIAPDSAMSPEAVYNSAFYLGIANQLTNILRDVGEDAMRGRVYLPQDELAEYGLTDKDVMARKVSEKWREFMKEQIKRARYYFDLAEEGASNLHKSSRWPVWSCLILYRQILDAIEENDYDNLTKRAFVGKSKKLVSLPLAYTRALSSPPFPLHSRFT